MLSEGRYGVEIITQISAVNTALEAVAVNVLNDHDNHCVAGGLACGDEGWRPRRAASCIARRAFTRERMAAARGRPASSDVK